MKDVSRRIFLRGMSLAPVAAAAGVAVGVGVAQAAVPGAMKFKTGFTKIDGFQEYNPFPFEVMHLDSEGRLHIGAPNTAKIVLNTHDGGEKDGMFCRIEPPSRPTTERAQGVALNGDDGAITFAQRQDAFEPWPVLEGPLDDHSPSSLDLFRRKDPC